MSDRELVVLGTASQAPTRSRNHNGYLLLWDDEGLLFALNTVLVVLLQVRATRNIAARGGITRIMPNRGRCSCT